jgi:asparagine N-glycosylation enzyme membrane subunit Stt3
MFTNLTDYKRKRKVKEAIGFYIAHFIVLLLLIMGLTFFLALITGNNKSDFAFKTGNALAILLSLIYSFLILKEKKLTGKFSYLLIAVASGVLAAFGGLFLGLIPAAYLTTK